MFGSWREEREELKTSTQDFASVKPERINPFPAKAIVPLVKIASKNSLSEKLCWPAVFVSKTWLHFGVHEK